MRTGKTEIILVVDHSGSMSQIKGDIEGGFAEFLKKQKDLPGEAYVTYYKFNEGVSKVFELKPIAITNCISIQPCGMTALLDGLGTAITETGSRLAKTPEEDRPESVIVVSITDGQENSSRLFDIARIKEMVTHQQDTYSWKFVFLGSGIDAFSTGASYGINGTAMTFANTTSGITNTFKSLDSAVTSYRCCSNSSYTFSEEEKARSMSSN